MSHSRITYKVQAPYSHPVHSSIAKQVENIPVLKNLNFGETYTFEGEETFLARVERIMQEMVQRFPNIIQLR